MQKIRIILSQLTPEAPLRILTEGFEGNSCLDEMRKLQKVLQELGVELSLKEIEKMLASGLVHNEQDLNFKQELCG